MYVRKKLDITWNDLIFGVFCCFVTGEDNATIRSRLETYWGEEYFGLAALSIRSGLDALLTALQLPLGSEILISAITIPDMVCIIKHHGLVPVPIDISAESLTITVASLNKALTPQTKAILFAHLFGAQVDLTAIAQFAKENHLLLLEDCAQAYSGKAYSGHPQSDVAMFSFGLIKTATALGGALLRFRDKSLHSRVKEILVSYPKQKRRDFLKKIIKSTFLKGLSLRQIYRMFYLGCRLKDIDHDKIIRKLSRSYRPDELFSKIRYQPSVPLLSLLERRLENYSVSQIAQRVESAQNALTHLHRDLIPGKMVNTHSYWLFPIRSRDPIQLAKKLCQLGFDATQGGSSLVVVLPPSGQNPIPKESNELLDHILFLPIYPNIPEDKIQQMCKIVGELEKGGNL